MKKLDSLSDEFIIELYNVLNNKINYDYYYNDLKTSVLPLFLSYNGYQIVIHTCEELDKIKKSLNIIIRDLKLKKLNS